MAVTAVFSETAVVGRKLVNHKTGTTLYEHPCPFTNVHASTVTDGGLLVAVADTTKSVIIILVTDQTATVKKTVRIPKSPTGLCFDGDKTLFISDRFGDIFRLSLDSDAMETVGGSVSTVTAVSVVGSQLLAADRDEKVRLFNLTSFELDGFLLAHRLYVSAVCVIGKDTVVVGGGDPFLTVWSDFPVTKTKYSPKHKIELDNGAVGVYALVPMADNLVAVLFDDSKCAVIVNVVEGKIVRRVEFDGVATSLSFVDGSLLVGLLDNRIMTFSVSDDYKLAGQIQIDSSESCQPADIWKLKYRKTFFGEDDDDDAGSVADGDETDNKRQKL